MKKPHAMIALIVILLLLIGGFLFMKKNPGSSMKNITSSDSTVDAISGTLEDLFAKNVPLQCTFSSSIAGQESSGSVMVSNKKMRGEFTTTIQGKSQKASIIQDGQYMYSWSSDQKMGTKLKMESFKGEVAKAQDAAQKNQALALSQQQGIYDCKPWIAQESAFTPPADVAFTDMTQMMEDSKKMMEKAPAAPCSVCDQVPAGASRDACKAQLKCS